MVDNNVIIIKKEDNNMSNKKFSDEFKNQIVKLYQSGKKMSYLTKEYELGASTIYKWINQAETTGSFKTSDNLTEEQKELKELRRKNKELEFENDILKQAALIMGRKSKS